MAFVGCNGLLLQKLHSIQLMKNFLFFILNFNLGPRKNIFTAEKFSSLHKIKTFYIYSLIYSLGRFYYSFAVHFLLSSSSISVFLLIFLISFLFSLSSYIFICRIFFVYLLFSSLLCLCIYFFVTLKLFFSFTSTDFSSFIFRLLSFHLGNDGGHSLLPNLLESNNTEVNSIINLHRFFVYSLCVFSL